jgi:hypothetical protein
VLPFGGIIHKTGSRGKDFKHTFDAARSEPISQLINYPTPTWNSSNNVALYFGRILIARNNL